MPNVSTEPPKGHETALLRTLAKQATDCISDAAMTEIARRLLVFFQKQDQDIVRSETPPTDKTKLWLPVDDTGTPTGVLQAYNPSTGDWVNASEIGACISDAEGNVLVLDEAGCLLVPKGTLPGYSERFLVTITKDGGGAGETDLVYTLFEDEFASIEVNPVTDPGTGFRWWVEDREVNGCTVKFAGLTPASMDFNIYARRAN